MSTFATFIQCSYASPSYSNQRRKGNKVNPNWGKKKELKLSLFAENMMLYTEDPKDAARKLSGLINESAKVAGYKINTQKSVAFLLKMNIEHSFKKAKNRATKLSWNPTPGHISGEKHDLKGYMHFSVHCSTVHDSQDRDAI